MDTNIEKKQATASKTAIAGSQGSSGGFLKAADLGNEIVSAKVLGFEMVKFENPESGENEEKPSFRIRAGDEEKTFVVNKTNQNTLLDEGYEAYEDVVGKTLKLKAMTTTYNFQSVKGIRIVGVE